MRFFGVIKLAEINPYISKLVEFELHNIACDDYKISLMQEGNAIGWCGESEMDSGLEVYGNLDPTLIKDEWIIDGHIAIEIDNVIAQCTFDYSDKIKIGEIQQKRSRAYNRRVNKPTNLNLPFSKF